MSAWALIKAILGFVFGWLLKPARLEKKAEKKEAKRLDARHDEIQSEVAGKDTDAVNARIGRILRVLVVVGVSVYGFGCKTHYKAIYVPESAKVVPMDLNGASGWWVPDHVLVQLLEKAEKGAEK